MKKNLKQTFRSLFPTHNDTSGEGFIFMSSCQQPKSRGYLTLRSSDPLDSPVIDPAFLEHPRDVACTIKGNGGETLKNSCNTFKISTAEDHKKITPNFFYSNKTRFDNIRNSHVS